MRIPHTQLQITWTSECYCIMQRISFEQQNYYDKYRYQSNVGEDM